MFGNMESNSEGSRRLGKVEGVCQYESSCMFYAAHLVYMCETDPFHVEHIDIDLVHNHHHRCFEILFSCVVPWHLEI
jgi:hypothetical protein